MRAHAENTTTYVATLTHKKHVHVFIHLEKLEPCDSSDPTYILETRTVR